LINNKKNQQTITIRKTKEVEEILNYLKSKLLLNTTSTIKLALVKLYEAEREVIE
jgi:hypothetical protein